MFIILTSFDIILFNQETEEVPRKKTSKIRSPYPTRPRKKPLMGEPQAAIERALPKKRDSSSAGPMRGRSSRRVVTRRTLPGGDMPLGSTTQTIVIEDDPDVRLMMIYVMYE